MKYFMIILLLSILACSDSKHRVIEKTSYPDLKEARLGESDYYVRVPSTMFIEEARGKEGQLGYGIWLTDSIARYGGMNGFIEIERGKPIGGKPDCDVPLGKITSDVLGSNISWKSCISKAGNYFSANASQDKLTFRASSPSSSGMDSMIAIISTLTKR